jgi:hypothetical protein
MMRGPPRLGLGAGSVLRQETQPAPAHSGKGALFIRCGVRFPQKPHISLGSPQVRLRATSRHSGVHGLPTLTILLRRRRQRRGMVVDDEPAITVLDVSETVARG